MKRIFFLGLIGAGILSCSSPQTELVGSSAGINPNYEQPLGMTKVGGGSFTTGPNDDDVPYAQTMPVKTVTMHSFYMDQTEITNSEYRQFVHWVRDSIVRKALAEAGVEGYELVEEDSEGEPIDEPFLNWDVEIDWSSDDEAFVDALKELSYDPDQTVTGNQNAGLDVRNWTYEYKYINNKALGNPLNRYNREDGTYGNNFESAQLYKTAKAPVYPDTTVWLKDFAYAYTFNEPIFSNYFSHPGYDQYPVVGVSWEQANAFCAWRTNVRQSQKSGMEKTFDTPFRLPTEMEWEYAARGNKAKAVYPWGTPYPATRQGCYLANFKPRRGEYGVDQYVFTAPANAYHPNGFGLFNMSGNVSEWTATPFEQTQYSFYHDLNPDYRYNAEKGDSKKLKRKVIKGGSWKDVAAFIQISARDYQYQNEASSFIGFRCVKTFENVRSDYEK
ncbi:MAG: SUMF1/EgtB/PvdO family nonheme iron enzyme [Flavobacteriales bacterium]|jgi:gliding motility-associated lipoprotein GldK|nr:SUMF1/EgtB/PvdO family nonheme iron enzyme [Flavobacteriales bacterium]